MVLADDDALPREGSASLLDRAGLEVVGPALTASSGVDRLVRRRLRHKGIG